MEKMEILGAKNGNFGVEIWKILIEKWEFWGIKNRDFWGGILGISGYKKREFGAGNLGILGWKIGNFLMEKREFWGTKPANFWAEIWEFQDAKMGISDGKLGISGYKKMGIFGGNLAISGWKIGNFGVENQEF